MLTFGSPACNTSDIHPAFESTGWKTAALDHITFRVADYRKEAAFYIALMGWKLRIDDGKQAGACGGGVVCVCHPALECGEG